MLNFNKVFLIILLLTVCTGCNSRVKQELAEVKAELRNQQLQSKILEQQILVGVLAKK